MAWSTIRNELRARTSPARERCLIGVWGDERSGKTAQRLRARPAAARRPFACRGGRPCVVGTVAALAHQCRTARPSLLGSAAQERSTTLGRAAVGIGKGGGGGERELEGGASQAARRLGLAPNRWLVAMLPTTTASALGPTRRAPSVCRGPTNGTAFRA